MLQGELRKEIDDAEATNTVGLGAGLIHIGVNTTHLGDLGEADSMRRSVPTRSSALSARRVTVASHGVV
jgi:hypothetical protein